MTHHHQPDRRNPLVLDVLELGRHAGTMRELQRSAPAPADLGLAVIGVPEGSPMDLNLRMEAVVEGVLVTGTVDVQLYGNCSRCLREIEEEASFDLQELYFHPGRQVEEDESLIVDELIDLEEALRGAVVLNLPFTPLCEPDCRGLCPVCGFNLNEDPSHAHEERIDPRWEKLAQLDLSADN